MRALVPGAISQACRCRALAAIRDFVRGRIDAAPAGALPVIAPPDAGKPSRSAGWLEQVMGKPAIVMAVAIGSEKELVTGNASAPIVLSVKFVDAALLQRIGQDLQLSGLRPAEDASPTANGYVTAIADPQGNPIARIAWNPSKPGGQVAGSVLPFIAVAIGG